MPAPTIDALFAFEDEIESAIQEMFTAIPYNAYRQRDTDSKGTPFVTVQLAVGGETGRIHQGATVFYPDAWTGTLTIGVVTTRGAAGISHTTEVSKVRRYMAEWTARLTSVQLPYHAIAEISASGTSPQIEGDKDHDLSLLTYTIKWMIRTTAWPA